MNYYPYKENYSARECFKLISKMRSLSEFPS